MGQNRVVEEIIISILCEGHALVESNPGLGKTLMISTISKAMNLKFSRIQCTPDLMPSDITGTNMIQETDNKKEFRFEPGPVFANIVLADEINRASPKTQSALLEAMQEKQVTVGNDTFLLTALLYPCYPEPHRNGGDLSPSRSPVRPFPLEDPCRLSIL